MKNIIDVFLSRNNFAVSGHSNPDGDTIGSCFALALALKKMGKQVSVLLDPYPAKYNIIPGRETLVALAEPADVFVAVDCASPERLGSTLSAFNEAKLTVCIDHHETNTGFADENYVMPDVSSTSELIYAIVNEMVELDKDIASAVYAGMVSDTGGFRFSLTGKSTMEIVAALMEYGIPFTDIYNEIMHMHSFAAGKALGVALDSSEQHMDGRIVLTAITLDMLANVGAGPSDLEGVVGYLMNTVGAEVAVIIYEKTPGKKIKVGLRSNGANMSRVALILGGGGHRKAAGADFIGTIEEAKAKTLELIETELSEHAD